MKRLFKKTKKLVKGMPTAVVVSILIHVGLFFGATVLVIFKFRPPPPVKFEPPPPVKVPKMPLKKLQMKMKKPTKPKSSAKITAVVPKLDLHEIQFPDLASSGIGAGLSGGNEVVSFGDMPIFDEDAGVFGGESSIGNDLEGTFYDLKRSNSGRRVAMSNDDFLVVVGKFTRGEWKSAHLAKYYRAPKKLYATAIMVPQMHSALAPAAFNEPDTEGLHWLVHYKGKLVYPESITFRFWGAADDLMLVRVDGETVLNASRSSGASYYSDWQSKGTQTRIHVLGNDYSTVGDWITLEPYTPLDMEVLIGERPGGYFNAMLLVEVKGVEYEMNKRGGPILPMFKTNKPSLDLLDAIYYNLVPGEATPVGGPVFRDYDDAAIEKEPVKDEVTAEKAAPVEKEPVDDKIAAKEEPTDEAGLRIWTTTNGVSFEGEFVVILGDKMVWRDAKGKLRKIPLDQFSAADQVFIELENPPKFNIDFTKQSKQYSYPQKEKVYSERDLPPTVDYVFSAKLKQTSAGSYNHELHVEFFAIGEEIDGDNYILLDRQKSSFVPSGRKDRSYGFSGKKVRLYNYEYGLSGRRGQQCGGYLIVVTDSRGKIIAHKSPYNWLFKHLEALREFPVGRHFDKTCTRVFPPRPREPWM